METLLPWNESLPDKCRVPKKTVVKKPVIKKDKGPLHIALIKLREKFRRQQETT